MNFRGVKRKSEELEIDELQLDTRPRLSQGSFTAIDCLSDDNTIDKSEGAVRSTKKSSQPVLKQSPASFPLSGKPQQNAARVLSNHLEQRQNGFKPDLIRATSPKVSQELHVEKDDPMPGVAEKLGSERIPESSFRTGPVADSEEDEEDIGIAKLRERHSELTNDGSSGNPVSPAQSTSHHQEPLDLRSIEKSTKPKHNHAGRNSSEKPSVTHSGASPFQRDSPTKLSSCTKSENSQLKGKQAVKDILTEKQRLLQGSLDDLQKSRKDISHEIYQCNVNGVPLTSEITRALEATSVKIDATKRLISTSEKYSELVQDRVFVKSRLIKDINDDCVTDSSQRELDQLISLKNHLALLEELAASLLAQSGLVVNDDILAKTREAGDSITQSHSQEFKKTGASISLVGYTQVEQQEANNKAAYRICASRHSPVPSIQQTPAPANSLGTPRARRNNDQAQPRRSPVKTYTSTPAINRMRDFFSPPTHRAPRAIEGTLDDISTWRRERPMVDMVRKPVKLFDKSEDDVPYTMHMSVITDADLAEDDYDPDDDVDMLEAAQELESRHVKLKTTPSNEVRKPLQETSGNAVRKERTAEGGATALLQAHQASQMQHPWSKDVKSAMRDRFHLKGFRPNQLEAINATLSGKDAFVLMPTGGGKSLCYQLPAIVRSGRTQGVTVVISPLLSLMQDQVDHLGRLKIQALSLNGEAGPEHRQLVLGALKEHDPQKFCELLYITPEMINKSTIVVNALRDLHKRKKLARIVIDEAHCVSQWGHDFRPDYKALGDIRRQFTGVPVIALTATATENVKVDVMHNLNLRECETFTQSFNRPNLFYKVLQKGKAKETLESIASTINERYNGQSGIVYCLSKKNCENVAAALKNQYSIKTHHYHAGMQPEERREVQKAWQAGHYKVIVATIAFGMGIDKADVRFVIHHTIPISLEGYYQETGRAGRDGKLSGCFLYYGYQDTIALKRMIDEGEGSFEQRERQMHMLRKMIQFCENKSDCRRVQVLGYFSETFSKENCDASCDNCKSTSVFQDQDFSHYAQKALKMVEKIENNGVTILYCMDLFRGASSKKASDLEHDLLPEYAAGSDLDRSDVERLFYRLLTENALKEENKTNSAGFPTQYIKVSSPHHKQDYNWLTRPAGKDEQRLFRRTETSPPTGPPLT